MKQMSELQYTSPMSRGFMTLSSFHETFHELHDVRCPYETFKRLKTAFWTPKRLRTRLRHHRDKVPVSYRPIEREREKEKELGAHVALRRRPGVCVCR